MRHVVILAKAPVLGRVKHRLARDIGQTAALRFYRAVLDRTARRLAADRRWTTWLAVTPDALVDAPFWPAGLPRLRQGAGDLGVRMARALEAPPRGPTLVVGADIPELDAGHIARAFQALIRADLVFGPAEDGGYWLIGARRAKPLPPHLFEGVRWSTEHALADTLGTIGASRHAMTDRLSDVDDGSAFAAWRARRVVRVVARPASTRPVRSA